MLRPVTILWRALLTKHYVTKLYVENPTRLFGRNAARKYDLEKIIFLWELMGVTIKNISRCRSV